MSLSPFIFAETTPAAVSTVASSQSVSSAASYLPVGVAGPLDDSDALDIVAELPANTTGGSIDVYVQSNPDGAGVNWFDILHFPQQLTGAGAVKYQAPVSLFTNITQPVVVGKNLSPAVAANTVVNGAYSDRCRLVMVAGSGANAGSAIKVTIAAQRSWNRGNG